jgi:hypothetical protein
MAETLWCANCGSAIHSTDRFCFQCGAENGHSVVPGGPETPPSNAWPFADTQTMPVAADAPFPAPFGPPVRSPGGKSGCFSDGNSVESVAPPGARTPT